MEPCNRMPAWVPVLLRPEDCGAVQGQQGMAARIPMTPDAQQPEHPCDTCENEKCPLFAKAGYKPIGNTSQYYSIRWVIEKVGCASHSNTRPHTPAPEPTMNVDGCLCLGCKVEDKGNGEPEYCLPIRNSIDKAARAATLETLDKIEQYAENMRSKREDGSLVMSYPIYPNDLDELVESLRRQQAGEQ
jgi:hypothetical protein